VNTRIFPNHTSGISFVKISLGVLFVLATPLMVQGADAEEGQQFFREKVYPILKEHCVKCHGGEKIKGGLVLTSRDGFLKGGENGAPLDTSTPAKSLLLDMMSYRDGDHEMPPAGKRPDSELAVFQKWLALGAPYDPALESAPKIAVTHKAPIPPADAANWWAYQPVREISAPTVSRADWARNPVDAFLLQSMSQAGLQPNPRAAKAQLVRRAYYDLIGLPPSPEEIQRRATEAAAKAEAALQGQQ
jgi:mono/diheme cytochrome c family protein